MLVSSPDDPHHQYRKKRVGKACDSCRIKKTKCDGKSPCSRCLADNKLCVFSEKKKSKEKPLSTGYVELLETKVDLLTKSLARVVTLAEPHIPLLQQILEKARSQQPHIDTSSPCDETESPRESMPINEVVSFLIADSQLLQGLSDQDKQENLLSISPIDSQNHHAEHNCGSHHCGDTDNHAPTEISHPKSPAHESAPQDIMRTPEAKEQATGKDFQFPSATTGQLDHCEDVFHNHGNTLSSRSNSVHSLSFASFGGFQGITETNDSFGLERFSAYETGSNLESFLNSPLSENPYSGYASMDSNEPFSIRSNSSSVNSGAKSGGTASTSPISVSSISGKLESQNFDDVLRHNVRRSHSTKGHMSSTYLKRKNSGHVHKPHVSVHSPQLLGVNSFPTVDNKFNTRNVSAFASTAFLDTSIAEPGVITTPFDFENDLMYNEPPSKVITDGIPLSSDNDDLAMNNFFMSSIP